jgi:sterol desaturase/sphingolipid hydroxylase (fatty acid hydroxylase superfamily)
MDQTFLIVTLYIVFGIFEFQFPAQSKQTIPGRLRNLVYALLLLGVGGFAAGFVYKGLSHLIPFEPRYLSDHGILFSILITFVYVFVIDFLFYWYHRAQHQFDGLWQIHELHHSDTELNATSSMRSYWLERPLQTLFISFWITYIVGVDSRAMLLLPALLTLWLCFTHANLKLRLGFLTPIICGPQLHRIHHSNLPQHQNKNFAQYFPVIDIMFGTYYAPKKDEFPTTGTHGLAGDASVVQVLQRPFIHWTKMIKKNYEKE